MAGTIEIGFVLLKEVMIIIIALLAISAMISTLYNPHEQAAAASVYALALRIDDLCSKTDGTSDTVNVNIPQPIAPEIPGLTAISQILMRVHGDPHYLVYYENFPPGEAVSWEVYNDYPNRAVIFADPEEDESLGTYLSRLKQELRNAGFASSDLSRFAFGNIILRDTQSEKENNLAGDIGHWEGNFYRFDTKGALTSSTEESLVKYRSCGEYSLCFKTHKGIRKIPLPNCERAGIKLMQVEQKITRDLPEGTEDYMRSTTIGTAVGAAGGAAIGAIATIWTGPGALAGAAAGAKIGAIVGGTTGALSEFLDGWINAKQTSDFYLSSPCKAELKITKQECDCERPEVDWGDDERTSPEFNMYSIESDDFVAEKRKKMCVFNQLLNEDKDDPNHQEPRDLNEKCIMIEVDTESGFCTGGNRLNQVTLSTSWFEKFNGIELERGISLFGDMKEFRKSVIAESPFLTGKGLRIPFGWP